MGPDRVERRTASRSVLRRPPRILQADYEVREDLEGCDSSRDGFPSTPHHIHHLPLQSKLRSLLLTRVEDGLIGQQDVSFWLARPGCFYLWDAFALQGATKIGLDDWEIPGEHFTYRPS